LKEEKSSAPAARLDRKTVPSLRSMRKKKGESAVEPVQLACKKPVDGDQRKGRQLLGKETHANPPGEGESQTERVGMTVVQRGRNKSQIGGFGGGRRGTSSSAPSNKKKKRSEGSFQEGNLPGLSRANEGEMLPARRGKQGKGNG